MSDGLGLAGRRYLVTGVLTEESIAWGVARRLQELGAEIVLTGFGRSMTITKGAADSLPRPVDVLRLDVTQEADFTDLAAELTDRWGALDGAVHAVAGASPASLRRAFVDTPHDEAEQAFRVGAYSLQSLARATVPLFPEETGGSIVAISFDSTRAWPGYNWMGVAKAGLESVCRYLAMDLGRHGVRVNVVSAGPLETVSAIKVSTFDAMADHWRRTAPLGWESDCHHDVVGPVLFLLSDLARAVTGEILHADGGVHAVGMEYRECPEVAR